MSFEPTARKCYESEGPGIGGSGDAMAYLYKADIYIESGMRVLDIGFGHGEFLLDAYECGAEIYGVDLAEASVNFVRDRLQKNPASGHWRLAVCDVSHETLAAAVELDTDSVDVAVCTETVEHLSNPYFAFAEAKRVLKHGGSFLVAFPMPEDNLGYKGGQHAHIYPGFLTRESFETFMRQLYFKQRYRKTNGSTAWYAFRNYKGPGVVDVFEIVAGNYTERQLFSCLGEF